MTASAFHPDRNVKRKERFQQTEECGHGRWLEGDSYKLDYLFIAKHVIEIITNLNINNYEYQAFKIIMYIRKNYLLG